MMKQLICVSCGRAIFIVHALEGDVGTGGPSIEEVPYLSYTCCACGAVHTRSITRDNRKKEGKDARD
jgi:RNase P subunit RPR2